LAVVLGSRRNQPGISLTGSECPRTSRSLLGTCGFCSIKEALSEVPGDAAVRQGPGILRAQEGFVSPERPFWGEIIIWSPELGIGIAVCLGPIYLGMIKAR